MGVRMSGAPSWASTEPSAYSTIECTMLCGCTRIVTCEGVRPNSRHASMSSRPLFMSVAESTEILRPMTQLGWAHAASGVTSASASLGVSRNGPPEAVSSTRVTPGGATPLTAPAGRHWKMALCSLSIGSSVAPEAFTAEINRGPAITSDSLLASSSRLPARAAASVERSPAAPTMAAITQSTSGRSASSSSAALPASTRVPSAAPSRSARSSAAACSSASAAYAGRKVRT